jgi:ligand-binding sensor domain-containing protein/serine phosphatase RsbU (regulator of sigma subunit)
MSTSANAGTLYSGHYLETMFLSVKNHIKFYMKRKVIIFFFFSILPCLAFSQSYNFRTFTSEDGLTQSYVYSIIQDVHGYLWIGTANGLMRYNGFLFENYPINDSLAESFITCNIKDGDGLWFGNYTGGLSYFDGKENHTVNLDHLNLSPVTQFARSPDDEIWAGTYSDGLLNLDKVRGVVKHCMFNEQTIIVSFCFLDNGELLIGTHTGLLFCRLAESGKIEIIRYVSEIPESKVICIQKMRNGSGFYIATENDGIFQLTYKEGLFKVLKVVADQKYDFKGIQYLYEDSQSDLWLCSFGKGLIKMDYSASGELKNINYFNRKSGFGTDDVKTIYEDREGNLWCGNYGQGLTQITPKTFSVFTFDNPLYGNNICSFCFDQKYRWIGTGNGLVKMDQLTGKVVRFYGKNNGLPDDKVTTLYSNDGKELWIGTGENGVFLMERGSEKIHKYYVENGALENSINIITGKGELVWIGTQKGLLNINSRTNKKQWFSINQGGLPHNYINSLYIDGKGRLWVSTPGSILSYIQDEKVFKIPLNSPGGNLALGPICEDSDSRIWVGSNGNGVFMIQSDSIVNLAVKEGLVSNYCYSVISDGQKNIWIGHKAGLSRIRTTDFSVKPFQHIESITDSYQFNPNSIIKDQQGKIWFGSGKGVVIYDGSMENQQYLPPLLQITSVRIDGEEKNITDKIVLAPGIYKIRIDFLGISLKEPELVTYQYKLEGYDQWSEITKNTSITYPRLTEGDYTFILKARSGDGVVSENPLKINFIIKVPVWKKWWFYPVSILIVALLSFIYIRRREYILQAEKRILEAKVRERTYEIQSQKNEIELQRDLINEKNANITASIKYAKHIQDAILPPVGLIDKLLPENFVLSKPKDIVSGDFYWLTEKENKIVITVADCTGHGVPGAFMSLLGITFLNEIVNIEGITKSVDIVTKLREKVIDCLLQGRKDVPITDGMDIALCVLDQNQKKIQFTGGMNDLFYISKGTPYVIKADQCSVCAFMNNSGSFTMKEINYSKGDIFYLFSDGFQDQFGGDFNKKYLVQHFRMALLEIHKLPMSEQKEILEYKFSEWKKDEAQTDDVTVVGIRL